MSFSQNAWDIFYRSISDYHIQDDVDCNPNNPYPAGSLEHLLYAKNWVDTIQWHLEDLIRDEDINPLAALSLKRRIDSSNQKRTDMVEDMDFWFLQNFVPASENPAARINTETPAWAVDRLSILALKIFHMQLESARESASEEHRERCSTKLGTLLEQKNDLSKAIDELLEDIKNGKARMKLYKQMKMYNDESLNPILYQNAKK